MKHTLFLFLAFLSCHVFAQTTDSITTPLGDFVVVTTEEILESNGYEEESTTTSDGGSAELLLMNSGNARVANGQSVSAGTMSVNISPNPASDIVQIDIAGVTGNVEITVLDLLGRTVYNSTFSMNNTRTCYLPTQLWSSGTFVVLVSAGSDRHVERLVVRE